MTYFAEERLDYIDWRLGVHGSVNRADIMTQFGVSIAQASKDLTAYERQHPGLMRYDKSAMRYIPVFVVHPAPRGTGANFRLGMSLLAKSGHRLGWH